MASARAADDDAAPVELGPVEGVKRAAVHVHDVVRHVDDVRDRIQPDGLQALLQPQRRGADLHVQQHAPKVARAECGVLHLHRRQRGRRRRGFLQVHLISWFQKRVDRALLGRVMSVLMFLSPVGHRGDHFLRLFQVEAQVGHLADADAVEMHLAAL